MITKKKNVFLALLVVGTMLIGVASMAYTPLKVAADPVVQCGEGATFIPPKGDEPSHCVCPAPKVLDATSAGGNKCVDECPEGTVKGVQNGNGVCNDPTATLNTCADGTQTADLSTCPEAADPALNGGNCADASNCDLLKNYLNPLIKVLSALVGVAVTIGIVYGGIQYASSGGDPQKAAAAKNRIRNAVIALITYIFLFALLNFLIPGGLV